MAERKQFKSVLDYRPQFENVLDALVPDIEFSYTAIISNSTVQTYFNMLSVELYGYEYRQLLRLNDLKFKLNERTLNLTVLEIVYNIVNEIIERKWRYSEYIAYDMYIIPLRIKKYVNAMNYRFIKTENSDQMTVYKLVGAKTRVITEEVVDTYHDDRINNIITKYRSCGSKDNESKLNLLKNLAVFIVEAKSIVYQKFGTEFAEHYYKTLNELCEYDSKTLNEKQRKFVEKNVNDCFDIGMLTVLLMSDAMKKGIWENIKNAERRRVEVEEAKKAIEDAERRLLAIKKIDEKEGNTLHLELSNITEKNKKTK